MAPFVGWNVEGCNYVRADRRICEATGATMLKLNGCVGCQNHVYLPNDVAVRCPNCRHPRFKVGRQPNEVSHPVPYLLHCPVALTIIALSCTQQICYYFPLREQLRQMLKLLEFRELLMHESRRSSRGKECMSDVYDSPRWQELMGDPTALLERICLQYCVDGVPAFSRMQCGSVKPAQCVILSLPPWLRYKARYMLVHMLVPAQLKGLAAKKYYDFAALYEMNELYWRGVGGVRVLLYGVTLDTPGRRELLSMQSVTAFYPCPHCLHTWQPGLRRQVYGGYRRFLDIHSPWRQRDFYYCGHRYMFRDVEERPPPIPRTDQNVAVMVALARPSRPFCGHKHVKSFLSKWSGVNWERSTCDVMHDIKCMCDMVLKGLVGRGRDGMYKSWSKDGSHRDDCVAFGLFADFADGTSPLPPWRLSKDVVKVMDMRVRSMWWPHYRDKLCKKNHSFWTHSDRMWKSSHKQYILLVILPTCLHGYVPAVHTAILTIVDALRRLDGQVVSVSESKSLGLLPGLRLIDKASIPTMGEDLVRGLVLLEGSFPVSYFNPAMHHLVHYGSQTARMGILSWFAMWSFERNNKRVKGFVRNPDKPLASVANNLQMDIATRLISFSERSASEFDDERAPTCELRARNKFYTPSAREKYDLGVLGVTNFFGVRAFSIARILGVHFKAGEWGRRRCGSVITTIYRGCSRYCVVKTFLRVQGSSYARVTWLSVPKYPCAPNLLVVRVCMLPHEQQMTHRTVIPIDKIDPCRVSVMPDEDGIHFFVMREKGYDRTGQFG